MKTISDQPTTLPPARWRRRIAVPMIFIGLIATVLLWGIIRGNWADARPINPGSASDGVLTQLLQTPEGRKQIRAAVLVEAPPEKVWRVVTDYDHFSDIFPNISTSKGVHDPDGRWHVTAEVHSLVGHWPMDLHVRHEESATGDVASWDEPNDTWKINRGSWVVSPHGSSETLLEYNLELKVSPYPDFIVRTVLLEQLKPAVRAVARRAQGNQPEH